MATIASPQDIETVLEKSQRHIDNDTIHFEERYKNMNFLNSNGISIDDALYYVYDLIYQDYFNGPTQERNTSFAQGDMWEFGISGLISPDEVYVKLKELLHVDSMICLSFHKAERPIIYPYRT
ncbi:hypothetical protein SFC42_22485 [Priestia filamentosa]|uniref:hypothetical protein n=1 Tax=Priestia filamentosa TaxID=1402861 RepID=UPI003982DC18